MYGNIYIPCRYGHNKKIKKQKIVKGFNNYKNELRRNNQLHT